MNIKYPVNLLILALLQPTLCATESANQGKKIDDQLVPYFQPRWVDTSKIISPSNQNNQQQCSISYGSQKIAGWRRMTHEALAPYLENAHINLICGYVGDSSRTVLPYIQVSRLHKLGIGDEVRCYHIPTFSQIPIRKLPLMRSRQQSSCIYLATGFRQEDIAQPDHVSVYALQRYANYLSTFLPIVSQEKSAQKCGLRHTDQSSKTVFPAADHLTTIWTKMITDHGLEKEFTPVTSDLVLLLSGETLSIEETRRKVLVCFVLDSQSPWYCRLNHMQAGHYDYAIASGICGAVDRWRKYSIAAIDY